MTEVQDFEGCDGTMASSLQDYWRTWLMGTRGMGSQTQQTSFSSINPDYILPPTNPSFDLEISPFRLASQVRGRQKNTSEEMTLENYLTKAGAIGDDILVTTDLPSSNISRRCEEVAGDVRTKTTVDRKQKRMIKNRESAARSRARKQAYTQELENKITELEKENEKLKKKKKKQQESDVLLLNTHGPEPSVSRLRRTSSSLF